MLKLIFVYTTLINNNNQLKCYLLNFPLFPLSPLFHHCSLCPLLIGCLHAAFLLAVCYLSLSCVLFSLASTFVEIGRIGPDEEKLLILKEIVQFSFTYGVSRGFLYI